MASKTAETLDEAIGTLFIDSGAHSLYTKVVLEQNRQMASASEQEKDDAYAFYDTEEFWDYVDSYAQFIKDNEQYVDYYVTVDVIFNARMSWRVQRYLEDEWGLNPLPVLHYGTPHKWIKRYLKRGYDFIGLGGLGQEVSRSLYYSWADSVYSDLICPGSDKLPIVKTHGFAMTSWELLVRYPWWSVDSASWVKSAGFGSVYIPRKKNGKYCFTQKPFAITVSNKSAKMQNGKGGRHVNLLVGREEQFIRDWGDYVGVPFGKTDEEGNEVEYGLCSSHLARSIANLYFYQMMADHVPEWPWPFKITTRQGFVG